MILTVLNVRKNYAFPRDEFRALLIGECHATCQIRMSELDEHVRFDILAPPQKVLKMAHFYLDQHGYQWHADRSA